MPFVVFETRWKKALSSILEELTAPEFKKLLFRLDKIPQGQKAEIPREALPDQIVKSYGPEGSILAIEKEMKVLPRNDARVQELLRPFVDKVREQKKLQQETRGQVKSPDEKVQWVRLKVTGVKSFNSRNTHLQVELGGEQQVLYVTTRLLVEALGFTPENPPPLPLSAKAQTQGKKITALHR